MLFMFIPSLRDVAGAGAGVLRGKRPGGSLTSLWDALCIERVGVGNQKASNHLQFRITNISTTLLNRFATPKDTTQPFACSIYYLDVLKPPTRHATTRR